MGHLNSLPYFLKILTSPIIPVDLLKNGLSGKQYRPWSDATLWGFWSWSALSSQARRPRTYSYYSKFFNYYRIPEWEKNDDDDDLVLDISFNMIYLSLYGKCSKISNT